MELLERQNPLNGDAVLQVGIDLSPYPGERKVRNIFFLPDGNLLMVNTDIIGAFDQPHLTEKGEPAHYSGKGEIIAAFEHWGKKMAMHLMPTDYLYMPDYINNIPAGIWQRSSVHVPASKIIPVEFIARSSCEGSLAEKASQGKSICGQELPKDMLQGQLLPRPYFTPTTKAPKGQKDQPLTLKEYFDRINDYGLAQYLYGMSVLLHLYNRKTVLSKGLDRPDQKVEFGLFYNANSRIITDETECVVHQMKWGKQDVVDIFNHLCFLCGFVKNAWRDMPLFDFNIFCEYATANADTCVVRLVDEYGGTDDGRYRLISDTTKGRTLIEDGCPEQGKIFLENYYCKEYFRLASKRTGKGGYEEKADQVVVIPDAVLQETGRRNLMALIMATY